ncbi:Acyl carrier protein [Clostridium liquoris]|uniref:Acyl carrier protein n=1 Tax=Clostridium liquoris TaxID=1289519 RepID=A0A2T0B6S1_9CLOT|nr:acyl carrier protein [Clostridium liquoris]PRR79562.1 Acyl carrier protein [Clostridium liquoris]
MIFEKIRKIIAEQLNIGEDAITINTSFEELGVDSLDLFQIVIEIEEEFNIQIEDAEAIKTVRDAVKFAEENTTKEGDNL